MQNNIIKKIIAFTSFIAVLPYQYIATMTGAEANTFQYIITLLLQATSLFLLYIAFKKTSSKSLKLFWQFFLFAVAAALVSKALLTNGSTVSDILIKDFFYLFTYFFIILAIETNPHISYTPLKNYTLGRVPAIVFTVVAFSYFILIPYEFLETNYTFRQPSILFHLVMTTLIFVRLFLLTLFSRERFWLYLYGALAIAAAMVLAENIFIFSKNSVGVSSVIYTPDLLKLLPYIALMIAVYISLTTPNPETNSQTSYPELYILILTAAFSVIHIIGIEGSMFYIANTYLQSSILGIWLLLSVIFIGSLLYKRNNYVKGIEAKHSNLEKQLNKSQQQNLKLSNSLFNSEDKAIVKASHNAILTTSIDGKVLSANPAAVQVFQCLEQEIIGSDVNLYFSTDDKMYYFFDFKSNVYSLQRKDTGISVECMAKRADGSEFPVQAELQWADRDNQPLIVITFINLTARKLAEKQALELKDKFIANISHEFRTPLTIINGILDRYLTKANTTEESKELTTAKRNGLRLVRMVEQLLELSRLSDNPSLTLSTYRLKTIMAMPSDSFARLAKQSGLNYHATIPDDLWLACDAQAFEKIIFNLLANAIKYTPAGGDISVNAYQENDTIVLDIIDTGIGINKASQEKIFERFQRADDIKNQAIFGVGIGLSLVNELVKAHHWRINLVSEYNQGSKFSLSIPMASPVDIESSLPMSVSENEVSSLLVEQDNDKSLQIAHSHNVVLVIEDNLDMQSHIKQVVEQKHHCMLAVSGELGLTLAQEYIPDLIVCDIMLTGIDGFEVLRQIKQNELTSHIPIILLTARSDLDSRLQGLNLHADDYLSKPFNQQELLVRIENLMNNRKVLQQAYVQQHLEIQKDERKESSYSNVSQLTTINDTQSLDEKFLEKLEAIVAKLYTEPDLGIERIASHLAMSERQLQRKIKVLLGTTPNNFIKEFRLRKAQELLKNGSQIGRIALDVGFSSQTYFGRCFKETFKCTPKQYQQQVTK